MYVAMHFAAAAQVLLRFEISFQPSAIGFQLFSNATNLVGFARKEAES